MARGLPQAPSDDDALAVALVMHDELADAGQANRASRIADAAEALLDRTMALRNKGLTPACRKGCGWCCWQRVTCTAPEVFRVAEWLRANAGRAGVPTLASIAAAEASDEGVVPTAALANRRPCALLVDNACGIHPGRPIPCRAVLSMSAEACRDAMIDPANAAPVPLFVGSLDIAEVVRTLMLATVTANGLSDAGYDLVGALALVLPDETAEQRWLAGEDVLATVATAPRTPAARNTQTRLAQMVKALDE